MNLAKKIEFESAERASNSTSSTYYSVRNKFGSHSTSLISGTCQFIVDRLKTLQEKFKLYARETKRQRRKETIRQSNRFVTTTRSNPRYFLTDPHKKKSKTKPETPVNLTIKAMPPSPRPARKKSPESYKSPEPPAPFTSPYTSPRQGPYKYAEQPAEQSEDQQKLSEMYLEIIDDINTCITGVQSLMESKHDNVNNALKKQMEEKLNNKYTPGVEADTYMAQYLKDFAGENAVDHFSRVARSVSFIGAGPTMHRPTLPKLVRKMSMLPDRTQEPEILAEHLGNSINIAQLQDILRNRRKWGFDIFKASEVTSNRPLASLVFTIFKDWDFIKKFQIDIPTLFCNVNKAEDMYRNHNPYHNSIHAADIFASTNYILQTKALTNVFTDLEVFAALYAAALHDIDHPGFTNQYMVRINSKAASLYSDRSVLEQHHVTQTLKLLNNEQTNILVNLKARDVKLFKMYLTEVIIATDHIYHMNHLTNLKLINDSNLEWDEAEVELNTSQERRELLQAIVHCCDISNPVKPLEQYKKWVERILTEFFRQGDLEKKRGLQPSPMCDRVQVDIAKTQVGFIDFVVGPIWETLADILHPEGEEMVTNITNNRDYYKENAHPLTKPLLWSSYSNISDVDHHDLPENFGEVENV